jgi:hypothetical protein
MPSNLGRPSLSRGASWVIKKLEANALIFKIFPGHLPDQALAKVIAKKVLLRFPKS